MPENTPFRYITGHTQTLYLQNFPIVLTEKYKGEIICAYSTWIHPYTIKPIISTINLPPALILTKRSQGREKL